MSYQLVNLNLSFGQIERLVNGKGTMVSGAMLGTGVSILLTAGQVKKLEEGKTFNLKLSKKQLKANMDAGSGIGDFFRGLGRNIASAAKTVGRVIKDNAPGVLKDVARYGIQYGLPIASAALNSQTGGVGGQFLDLAGQIAMDKLNGGAQPAVVEGGSIMIPVRRGRPKKMVSGGAIMTSVELPTSKTRKGKPQTTFVPQVLEQQMVYGSGLKSAGY